jgi:hypothetical protein
MNTEGMQLNIATTFNALVFSHPDFTVGPGISPDQPCTFLDKGSRTFTAGREFHPAPKKLSLSDANLET